MDKIPKSAEYAQSATEELKSAANVFEELVRRSDSTNNTTTQIAGIGLLVGSAIVKGLISVSAAILEQD